LSETYRESSEEDLGVEYVKNLLSKYSLSWTELCEVMSFAKDLKIDVLCTPFDIRSAAELISFGVDGIKIASADLTNHELMRYCGQSGIPMIVSTGMSTELEIIEGADLLTTLKSDYAFLHCNSTYPAPYDDINLKFINRLRALGLSEIVGWSGHERGFHVCIAAVAMGAKIIEKHFTLDKTFEGNDHKVSLLPGEFKLMVDQIREVESAFGSDGRIVSQGEMINRENLSKSIVAKFDISKDEVLTRDMIEFRSPGRGIQPNRVNEFLGRKVVHPVKANDFIYPSTFEENTDGCELKELPGVYYGIPVRYHDIHHSEGFGNMVEFHLTYDDLSRSESLNNMIIPENVTYFTVHAPEMFADDRLLNLAACDEKEFIRSIENMKTVIEIADKIRVKVGQHKVYVVTNVGGFTNTGFEHDTIKLSEMYQRVSEAIDILRHPNVELIIQTMPPFPWHFGGQAYHNLFVNPREIIDFCSKHSTKICLDLSHTFLACKFLGTDFYLAIEELMPFTQHLHVSDAEGLSGEGLQIGNGSINWERIASIVSECKNDSLSVIPEVWQGHKDQSFHAKKGLSIFLSFF
jgi:N-acetylneuraminate synthase